jgi:ABC-type Fe3+/spermidine/putrescine transport system ATPase subunit
MVDTAVRLDGIQKHFGSVRAVDNLSLDIEEGEIFTLLGPSGCGKTTTLRMLAGLETPTGGDLYFRDRPIVITGQHTFVPPNKRNVGMVFQSYAIWPHMTVFDNVAYPLQVRGVSRKEVREKVTNVLGMLGLGGLEGRLAPMLSGGQQQRVALARALVYEPQLLLLDEPFSNLDAKLREQLRIELKVLQRRLGITVVFVTHDQVEALSLSDRLAVMNQGQVEQMGTPDELYARPQTPFVRDFLGRTVLLRGIVQENRVPGLITVALHGQRMPLIAQSSKDSTMTPGQSVYVGMRPEDVEIVSQSEAEENNTLRGTVLTQLFTGERVEVDVELGDDARMLVYAPRRLAAEGGQTVYLRVRQEAVTVWLAEGK